MTESKRKPSKITDKARLDWLEKHKPRIDRGHGWVSMLFHVDAHNSYSLGRKTYRQTLDLCIRTEQRHHELTALRAERKERHK